MAHTRVFLTLPCLLSLAPPLLPHGQGPAGEAGLRALQDLAATTLCASGGGADVGAERLLGVPSGEPGFSLASTTPDP